MVSVFTAQRTSKSGTQAVFENKKKISSYFVGTR